MWSTLEVAKLAVSSLTPVSVAIIGFFLARISWRVEEVQRSNRAIVDRRLELYNQMAPKLNRLYCFYMFIGSWKETDPQDVIRLKRELDEMMYVHRVVFSDALFDAYRHFSGTLFHMYGREDADALLRAEIENVLGSRARQPWWTDDLKQSFSPIAASAQEIVAAYETLNTRFREDLFVSLRGSPTIVRG